MRVGVRVNDPAALDRIVERLPHGWKPAKSPYVDYLYSLLIGGEGPAPGMRRFHLLYGDSQRLARTLDLEEVFDVLEADLQLYIAEWNKRRVFVHAGVVGWRGRAIVIPGRSFSGKSTLVAELVRLGATYYSDEYAVVDSNGKIHPYPKPLSIRENGSTKQRRCPVEQFGGKAGSRPLPAGLVLVGKYRPEGQWRPRRVSAGMGALALLSNTVSARTSPESALDALKKLVTNAMVLKGDRGEAKHLAHRILERVS
jgi:hypothetical protein